MRNLSSAIVGIIAGSIISATSNAVKPEQVHLTSAVEPIPIVREAAAEEREVVTAMPADAVYVGEEPKISMEELDLLAALVYAEAGNQSFEGKCRVVDVVLNRVDDTRFPNTITEVVYQKNQFGPVSNGALDAAYSKVTDEEYRAVMQEVRKRIDQEILYFCSGGYSQYGTAAYKCGDHYFSK